LIPTNVSGFRFVGLKPKIHRERATLTDMSLPCLWHCL
jgi:hypothetical protein